MQETAETQMNQDLQVFEIGQHWVISDDEGKLYKGIIRRVGKFTIDVEPYSASGYFIIRKLDNKFIELLSRPHELEKN